MPDEKYVNLTHQSRRENPLASSKNKMKLGVFSLNTDGGMAVTKAPERLHGDDWARNLAVAQKADRSGFEAIIASGRWKGFGGERNSGGITYETYAWAAGLSALTKDIGIIATSHLTTVHPVFAAKQAATIDHISGGRFGLNILVGWNVPEMLMFSNSVLEHDERYDYADEWIDIAMRAWSDKNPFDFRGRFFDLKQVISEPKPLNIPYLINAGSSPRGKQFCTRYCDAAFLRVKHLDGDEVVKQQIASYKDFARTELNKDLKIWCYGYVVQGDTEKEAFDYLDYYVNKLGDDDEANAVMAELGFKNYGLSSETWANYLFQFKAGFLGVPLIGTPDTITRQFQRYSELGVDGIALGWLDYHSGISEFAEKVLPRMEEVGLRIPFVDADHWLRTSD